MADVKLSGVSKSFGTTTALSEIDLNINDGEFVVLLGPTGAGKTTTLRVVAGLEQPDAGEVSIDGVSVNALAPATRDVSFVFQQYSLYPHFSVFDNLAFPLRSPLRKKSRTPDQIDQRVREVAELLSITDKLNNKATALSGGEMQRVAIGRALVRDPSIFLMDEPLSSLDAKLRGDLRIELKRIQQVQGATILYVTHDQIEAMTMASRVGVLNEGRLIQFGTPREIYQDPDDEYVATRLGLPHINLVPVAALAAGISRDSHKPPSTTVNVGVRTEHIELLDKDSHGGRDVASVAGVVAAIEHLGDQTRLTLELDGTTVVALADPHRSHQIGERLGLSIKQPLYFDANGQRLRA